MSFQEAIQSVFQKYICFSGRARRSEYWYFALLNWGRERSTHGDSPQL